MEPLQSVTQSDLPPESVSFKTYSEIGLRKITNVNNKNIYEATKLEECKRYMTIPENINYVGIVRFFRETYYFRLDIFNLFDDGNFSELEQHYDMLNKITQKQLIYLGRKSLSRDLDDVMGYLKRAMPNFFLITPLSGMSSCKPLKDLQPAKEIIDMLNEELEERCPGFRLNIDYIFNLPNPSFVTLYSGPFMPKTLLLCLFNGNNCVSSLTLKIENGVIEIDSKTEQRYEGRKFNKLLRAVIILIGSALGAKTVLSSAINPISAYLMKNSFHAKTDNRVIDRLNTLDEIKAAMETRRLATDEDDDSEDLENNDIVYLTVDLNDETSDNAKSVFEKTLTEINCSPISHEKARGRKTIKKGKRKAKRKTKSRKTKKYKLH